MASSTPWWSTFFSGPVLDVLRNMFPPQVTMAECDFIWQRLGLSPGMTLVDVPCGAGRHALEMARRGCKVTGVDLTPELIADAKAAGAGLTVDFVVADMRDLPGPGRFDAAICFGNSFAYLDHAGNAAFLAAVRRALKPGGRFLLETRLVAESVFAMPRSRTWYPFGDTVMLHDTRYDPTRRCLTSEYRFIQDGRMDCRTAEYTIYLFSELLAMLSAAGLEFEAAFGSLAGDPFALGAAGLYLSARRPVSD